MSQHGSLDEAYDDFPRIEEPFQELLDQSLNPRGPDSLFSLLETVTLPARGVPLDIGCGEGQEAIELSRRFGLHVQGIDPVARHIELATAGATRAGLGTSVNFRVGFAETLRVADASIDLVWCKEVLMFVDLDRAFDEIARVLRPSGVGLVYQVLTGPRMSDAEADMFWEKELAHCISSGSNILACVASWNPGSSPTNFSCVMLS